MLTVIIREHSDYGNYKFNNHHSRISFLKSEEVKAEKDDDFISALRDYETAWSSELTRMSCGQR
jgi:hypothetical protein